MIIIIKPISYYAISQNYVHNNKLGILFYDNWNLWRYYEDTATSIMSDDKIP